jgi:hypothetical protein
MKALTILTLTTLIITGIAMASTCGDKKTCDIPKHHAATKPKPTPAQHKHIAPYDILCYGDTSDPKTAMVVYMDAAKRELIVNGEIHRLTDFTKYSQGMGLHTENFINLEGQEAYITIAAINKGPTRGMFMALYNTETDWPESVIPVRCKRVHIPRS